MIVVAIIGVLAAIALPAFIGYMRRAKASEAPSNLKMLFTSAATYYSQGRTTQGTSATASGSCTVGSTSGTLPATPNADKQLVDFLTEANFHALFFEVSDPIYFGYGIASAGSSCDWTGNTPLYSFYAEGDLDGDSTKSLFELAVGSNPNNELYRAPGFYVTNELE